MFKSVDPVREHGVWKEGEPAHSLYCKFCNHHITAGVTRLKHHLAGTHKGVRKCDKVPELVKKQCVEALKEMETGKAKKAALVRSIGRMEDSHSHVEDAESQELESGQGSNAQQSRSFGPLDTFVNVQGRQTTMENRYKIEQRDEVVQKIGRCIFANGLSFNLLSSPYWREMVDVIGKFGPGLKQPSPYEIRTRVLKKEVEGIDSIKAKHKAAWEKYGCTIMSDGWSDKKSRSLINFLVNSPEGTFFYKSIDASTHIKNGEYLFQCIDKIVEEIGEQHVLQVITDNHASYVLAGTKLMEVRKSLYWTPCAAHCIDLMLEDIGKMKIHR
ncbi:uncharacterized protein LOC109846637 [Asparagus officinalis]|uniref:uncharacterized protein LOC109846637 n=1 Tax=Asparagus officinalis TaxID=4686 RepID=UPI00098DF978|nr:uncharacterized protein LOC109846637 [Asparagus officinalis]